MKEIEVKFIDVDLQAIQQRLKKLRARCVFDGEMDAIYFDFANKRLNRDGKLLRVRKKGAKVELTYKVRHKHKTVKLIDEHQTLIQDFEVTRQMLKGIGMREVKRVQKHRVSYVLGKNTFEIDTFPGIPPFLEIESTTISDLKKAVKVLGLSMKEAKPWTSKDIFKYYAKR